MKKIASVVSVFIPLPIWFYLVYQILVRVQASELMMFLFWVYVPVSVFVAIVTKYYEGESN